MVEVDGGGDGGWFAQLGTRLLFGLPSCLHFEAFTLVFTLFLFYLFGVRFFSFLSLFSPLSTHFLFYSWRLPIFHFILFSLPTYSLLSILYLLCFPFFVAMNTTIVVRCVYLKEENFGVFTFSI